MECTRLVGALVAGRCGHPLNAPVSVLAYLLLCLRPWALNEWAWALSEHQRGGPVATGGKPVFSADHKRLVRWLALACAVGGALRLLPCLPGDGAPSCQRCAAGEPFCEPAGGSGGDSGSGGACARLGAFHVFWRLPLRANGHIAPGLWWGHVAVGVLPTLAAGGAYERKQLLLLLACGAGVGFFLARLGSDPATRADEAAALASLLAAPCQLLAFAAASHWRVTTAARAAAAGAEQSGLVAVTGSGGQGPEAGPRRARLVRPGDDDDLLSDLDDYDDEDNDDDDNLSEVDSLPSEPETESLVTVGGTTQVRRRKRL